jgi:subtilisin family serine protease
MNIKKIMNLFKKENPFKLPPYKVENVIASLSQLQDWGIIQNNIPDTWKVTRGEESVVMVLDTGYTEHIDLKDALISEKCITTVDNDKTDKQYHSTHCCGIIGARDNDIGCVGVAPSCKIITVKVLGNDGSGSFEAIVKGLEYAAKIKPDIVSMSLGAPVGSDAMHNAIKKLYDMNIPCICAAGNEGPDSVVGYPAKYSECIAVAAYDKDKKIADFSSPGKEVLIAAPGVSIYSTYGNNTYAKLSGTSMATPFISGLVALLISKHKKQERETGMNDCKTVDQIKEHLKKYAVSQSSLGKDDHFGYGIVDAAKLIEANEVDNPIVTPVPVVPTKPKSFWFKLKVGLKQMWNYLVG